jgi:hypothetical protein
MTQNNLNFIIMIGRNETDYAISGGGGGFGFGGFGGGWGIPPVGLFGVMPFGRGFGHDGNDGNRGRGMDECCCDIRADIGETKFKIAEIGLQNANALQKEVCNVNMQSKDNTFQIEKELFGLQRDALGCCCETQKTILAGDNMLEKSILTQGFQNQLANCQQTNTLQNAINNCCCETNLNIERTANTTQIRDLQNFNAINVELTKLSCGQKEIIAFIANQAKDNKIECLEKELRQSERRIDRLADERISGRTNCLVTQLGDANRAFFGQNFPWSIPVCGCGCGFGY